MTPARLSMIVVAALCAAPALAQTPSEGPIVDWLVGHEVSIRKTFDGKSRDEKEAAKVSYNAPDAGDPFWLVDLGVKFSERELCPNCIGKSVIFYPILEWHRSTSDVGTTNKLKVGPSIDFLWGDINKHPLALIMPVRAAYVRDMIEDVNVGNASVLVGLMGANRRGGGNSWLPMSHVNDRSGNLVFRYAPFIGIERYDNLLIERKDLPAVPAVALTALAVHLQTDLYPFNTRRNPGWFEITIAVAYRRPLAGDEGLDRNLPVASVSANAYLDGAGHFAVGLDHENGRSPTNNFDRQHSTSVGFKVKF